MNNSVLLKQQSDTNNSISYNIDLLEVLASKNAESTETEIDRNKKLLKLNEDKLELEKKILKAKDDIQISEKTGLPLTNRALIRANIQLDEVNTQIQEIKNNQLVIFGAGGVKNLQESRKLLSDLENDIIEINKRIIAAGGSGKGTDNNTSKNRRSQLQQLLIDERKAAAEQIKDEESKQRTLIDIQFDSNILKLQNQLNFGKLTTDEIKVVNRTIEQLEENRIKAVKDLRDKFELNELDRQKRINENILESNNETDNINTDLDISILERRRAKIQEDNEGLTDIQIQQLTEIINEETKLRQNQIRDNIQFEIDQVNNSKLSEAEKKAEIERIRATERQLIDKSTTQQEDAIDALSQKAEESNPFKKWAETFEQAFERVSKLIEDSIGKTIESLERNIEGVNDKIASSKRRESEIISNANNTIIDSGSALQSERQRQSDLEEQRLTQEQKIANEKKKLLIIEYASQLVNSGQDGAFGKAVTDGASFFGIVDALIDSLPTFFTGTDGTIAESLGSPQLSGRDGYVVRVDGGEKVLNKKLSDKTGTLNTKEIAEISSQYLKGDLVSSELLNLSMQNDTKELTKLSVTDNSDTLNMLSNQFKGIEKQLQNIANKPETEISTKLMSDSITFVKNTRKGNIVTKSSRVMRR